MMQRNIFFRTECSTIIQTKDYLYIRNIKYYYCFPNTRWPFTIYPSHTLKFLWLFCTKNLVSNVGICLIIIVDFYKLKCAGILNLFSLYYSMIFQWIYWKLKGEIPSIVMGMAFPHPFVWRNDITNSLVKLNFQSKPFFVYDNYFLINSLLNMLFMGFNVFFMFYKLKLSLSRF